MCLELVFCDEIYWEFVRKLRNNKKTSIGFIENRIITVKEQKEYMKINSKNYRIALYNKTAVGYVGVINNDIRVCTHPEYQGKGIGKFMILECLKIWPKAQCKIKIDNLKSIKLFESCGFKKQFYLLKKDN